MHAVSQRRVRQEGSHRGSDGCQAHQRVERSHLRSSCVCCSACIGDSKMAIALARLLQLSAGRSIRNWAP